MSPLVRAACLTNYSEVARASGLDPARTLAEAGLHPGVELEPDLLIPVDRVGRLLQASAHQSGNEAFGLCMAESRRLSNLGAVGMLIRDQPTLRDSLQVLMRYQALLNGSMSMMVEDHDGLAVLRQEVQAGRPQQSTRQRIELAIGVMLGLMRQFLGEDWRPRRVCLEHPAPRELGAHQRVLGHALSFNADFNGIVCTQAELDASNSTADPAMVRYAQQLLDAAVKPKQLTLALDVQRTVVLLLPSGRCSIEQVADRLGLACRTVQRGLAEQGQRYSSLVNDVRRELAMRHVLQSDRPLTEVAALLGFSAPSAFSRWYVAQFGCSATRSRAERTGLA